MRAAAAALLGLWVCACASLPRGEAARAVEAEGWAPEDPADPAGSRRRAILDAQRRAVEEVAGLWLTSRTEVDRAIAVTSRLKALSRGSIRRYEVLEERLDGGFRKARIRAWVLLKDRAGGLGVRIDIADAGLASAVEQALAVHGYSAVSDGADLVVTGSVKTTRLRGAPFAGFSSFRASVSLAAARPDSSPCAFGEKTAAAIDASSDLAREKAVRLAAQQAAASLASALTPEGQPEP